MDDLLREFLTESAEHLDTVDVELVRFEQEPDNQAILRNIFRLVHTIKGTCGFLGLPRLEALAHAAETVMGRFRDGFPVSAEAVSLILATLDRLKEILAGLEASGSEPEGSDADLIDALDVIAQAPMEAIPAVPEPVQTPERELKPGEVSLDELERAFRDAPGPDAAPEPSKAPAPVEAAKPAPKASPKPAEKTGEGEAEAAAPQARTIRVNVETLEHLMTMVSELVLTRNQLLEIARRQDDTRYKVPLQRLSHVTAELQDGVMKTRMQPIGNAWQKLPRVVRDLSAELGKGIELVMQGAETELDRQVLELIKDPLTHMVRNSADHGIEPTVERLRAGKAPAGAIRLSAYHEGGTISIEIADDGRGLDLAAIRRKAVERGIASQAEVDRMSDGEAAKFIFHAGFSTAAAVTSVSGRGVGMDVVKTNIEAIGGLIDIATQPGTGTTFVIKIPLTLAIISALIVKAGGHRYAVPQNAVLELVRVEAGGTHRIEHINGAAVLRLRERLLPVVTLAGLMNPGAGTAAAATEVAGFVAVAQVGRNRFGILVDDVFHMEEIVVKPMSSKLRHIPLFAGNTILGDGAVVLIVDPNGIARAIGQSAASGSGEADAQAAAEPTTTMLVFKAAGCIKGVPLALVTRIEEVDASRIEWLGGRPLIQYRGRLMPLVPADNGVAIRSEGSQALVVVSDGERAMGLVIDEIVDIVEEPLRIEIVAGRSDLIGSAVLRGRATDIIDVAHFLPLAYDDWTRGPRNAAASSRKPTLLLVDDSAFFRDLLTPVLKAAGFEVATAASAEEALGRLKAEAGIGIVVADLEMPGRNGFDLVAAMRAAGGRLADLPVIALSGTVGPETVARARTLAISDLVAKFDRSGLVAALGEIDAGALAHAA